MVFGKLASLHVIYDDVECEQSRPGGHHKSACVCCAIIRNYCKPLTSETIDLVVKLLWKSFSQISSVGSTLSRFSKIGTSSIYKL